MEDAAESPVFLDAAFLDTVFFSSTFLFNTAFFDTAFFNTGLLDVRLTRTSLPDHNLPAAGPPAAGLLTAAASRGQTLQRNVDRLPPRLSLHRYGCPSAPFPIHVSAPPLPRIRRAQDGSRVLDLGR